MTAHLAGVIVHKEIKILNLIKYQAEMKHTLEKQENLEVKQGEIVNIEVKDGKVVSIETDVGAIYKIKAVDYSTSYISTEGETT